MPREFIKNGVPWLSINFRISAFRSESPATIYGMLICATHSALNERSYAGTLSSVRDCGHCADPRRVVEYRARGFLNSPDLIIYFEAAGLEPVKSVLLHCLRAGVSMMASLFFSFLP